MAIGKSLARLSYIGGQTLTKMEKKAMEVFRRYDRFDEALTYALAVRGGCDFLRIIYSPAKEHTMQVDASGQVNEPMPGPWIVTTDIDMVRTWETVCARFLKGERGRIDRTGAANIERRRSLAQYLPAEAQHEEQ